MQRQNVMWNGTCNQLDFRGQVDVARLSGCEVLSITPFDYRKWRDEGVSLGDMKAIAQDAGVEVSHLDPIATWAPKWKPDNVPEEFMPFFGISMDDFFRCVNELECKSITANCTFPLGAVSEDALIESFADLCTRASGLRVDLEFVPLWGLPDLDSAWRVVEGAGAANGGLMFDFWHFFRSNPNFDLLESIPAEKIHAVQGCDAMLTAANGRTPLEDTLEDRMPLGEGEFNIRRILETLSEKAALGRIGPEYFCKGLHGMTASEIANVVDRTFWARLEPYGIFKDSGRREGRQ